MDVMEHTWARGGESDNQSAFRRTPADSFPMIGWSSAATGGLAGSSKRNPFHFVAKWWRWGQSVWRECALLSGRWRKDVQQHPNGKYIKKKLHKHIRCEEFGDYKMCNSDLPETRWDGRSGSTARKEKKQNLNMFKKFKKLWQQGFLLFCLFKKKKKKSTVQSGQVYDRDQRNRQTTQLCRHCCKKNPRRIGPLK